VEEDFAVRVAFGEVEQDEVDNHSGIGEGFDAFVESGNVGVGDVVGLSFKGEGDTVGFGGEVEDGGDVAVKGGVLDADSDGVVEHLDLQAFFGLGAGEGGAVGHS